MSRAPVISAARALAAAALAGLLAPAAPALARAPKPPGFGEPSDLVASETALAQAAAAKGQWAALRAFAAPEAQWLPPDGTALTPAQAWLKTHPNPATPTRRDPHNVWMSCDGSAGVTYGALGDGGRWFATVWQRDAKGAYRFVLDQWGPLARPLPPADWIEAKQADCPLPGHRRGPTPPAAPLPETAGTSAPLAGQSADATLAWQTRVAPDGTRHFSLRLKTGGKWQEVLGQEGPARDTPAQDTPGPG